MSKAFEKMKAGLEEALAYAQGTADESKYRVHVPAQINVKAIRTSMDLSQEEFAQRFNLTAARVRDWEQGRSKPDSAARAYLVVIMNERTAVERALSHGIASDIPMQKMVTLPGRPPRVKSLSELMARLAKKGRKSDKKITNYGLRSEPKTKGIVIVTKRGGARKRAG